MAVFVASTAGRPPAGLLHAPSTRREIIDLDTYELFRRGSELLAAGHAHQAVISLEQARDAAPGHGSVREALLGYAKGRNDPLGPMGAKEYLVSMDRYCGFVYQSLTGELLRQARLRKQ